jgi:hypothetical protein
MSIIQELHELRFNIIPVPWGEKIARISWKQYQEKRPTTEQLNEWFPSGIRSNVAIITGKISGIIGIDADSEEAKKWVEKNLPPTSMMTKTYKGVHYYYKHPGGEVPNKVKLNVDGKKLELDIRGDGGYVIAPGSKHPNGSMYEQVGLWNLRDVPVFDPNWFPSNKPQHTNVIDIPPSSSEEKADAFNRARKYLDKVPGAVEGQGGDTHTFATACKVLRGFGLSYDETLMLMYEWNMKKCDPPWSDHELEIKLENALKYGTESVGRMNLPTSLPFIDEKEVKFIHLADCKEPGPTPWLVDNIIPLSHITTLYADGGHGKTFLAIYLAQCIALGKDFIGFPTLQSNVLYLDWEMCEDAHKRRAYKIARGLSLEQIPKGCYYYRPHQPMSRVIPKIKKKVDKYNIGFVIIDSMGLGSGVDQESASQIIPLFAELNRLGLTNLIIDHQSKMQEGQSQKYKTPFGSTYKHNSSRSVIQLRRTGNEAGHIKLVLDHKKNNMGVLQDKIPLIMKFDEDSVSIERSDTLEGFERELTAKDKILHALEEMGPSTANKIADKIKVPQKTVANKCSLMAQNDEIEVISKDGTAYVYSLPFPPPPNTKGSEEEEIVEWVEGEVF